MSEKVGLDCKAYRNTGSYNAPTWSEVTIMRDLTLNLSKGEADVSSRGSRWKKMKSALKEASFEFEILGDTANAHYTALRNAYLNDTTLDLAFADGDITVGGTEYWRGDVEIFQFNRGEPLEDGAKVSVTAKPTYSTHEPGVFTV